MRLAILTEDAFPDLTADDRLLLPALTARSAAHRIDARPVSWSDPAVDWHSFDGVLVRSPWDYYRRLPEFLAFLDRLEAAGPQVMNPIPVLRANSDKRYLLALAQAGVPIVPTRFLTTEELPEHLPEEFGGAGVLKPEVSGNAMDTIRFTAAEWPRLRRIPRPGARWMLQPYLPQIETAGEISLIWIGGQFSHAVRKVPGRGDFRVQADHGGQFAAITPDPAVLTAAERVMAAAVLLSAVAPGQVTYARVDGVEVSQKPERSDGEFLLMELELLEPNLFLGCHPEAAARLAAAVETAMETAMEAAMR